MSQKYFEITLSKEQIDKLPDWKDKITPAKLRHIIQDVLQDDNAIDKLILEINKLIN